jgi:hypothetical protein
MPGDTDPRLVNFLQGVLGLTDVLRDAGASGELILHLTREDGLKILQLVAGACDAEAEAFSQQGRPQKHAVHSLSIAGLTVEWPRPNAPRQRPEASRMFSAAPKCVGVTANTNSAATPPRRYQGFEEDSPSLQ